MKVLLTGEFAYEFMEPTFLSKLLICASGARRHVQQGIKSCETASAVGGTGTSKKGGIVELLVASHVLHIRGTALRREQQCEPSAVRCLRAKARSLTKTGANRSYATKAMWSVWNTQPRWEGWTAEMERESLRATRGKSPGRINTCRCACACQGSTCPGPPTSSREREGDHSVSGNDLVNVLQKIRQNGEEETWEGGALRKISSVWARQDQC